MQTEKKEPACNAGAYIRISKDDAEKSESYSVSNQRELILLFLKSHPEIKLCAEYVDDGYSGVDFERPAVREMLSDIKKGSINCVIVKDLSRFGRNYIETGRYLEQIFPFLGVRFIALNDNYDSAGEGHAADSIVVPFKNLMNDAYSRDISIKVRSQLEVRRKRGDYIGSSPVYGYRRAEDDKHRLVADDFAARIVRDIFKWKISGMNNRAIAGRLEEMGVPSPAEHKTAQNQSFYTPFRRGARAGWSPVAVGRILKNELYTGTMVQGKETTLSYKVKKRVKRPPSDWIRVGGTHEPIVSKEDFALVGKLLLADTRTAPESDELYLLSGILKCGDCGQNMIRKPVKIGDREYVYYICSTNKRDRSKCADSHRVSERSVADLVLKMLKLHMATLPAGWDALGGGDRAKRPLGAGGSAEELTRPLLLSLVDKIEVFGSRKLRIRFTYVCVLADSSLGGPEEEEAL